MNKVILMGRLTKDPEVKCAQTSEPMAIARYNLAVDRPGKKEEGKPSADFISCVAFGKRGEFAEKYLRKGMKIALSGRIQTGSYTAQDGSKRYTTDVIVDEHYFCESKKATSGATTMDENGFMNIPDGIEEELPFN